MYAEVFFAYHVLGINARQPDSDATQSIVHQDDDCIARKIQIFRIQRGMNLQTFAHSIGQSAELLARIERKEVVPDAGVADAILRALD